jgi:hypothetical protein
MAEVAVANARRDHEIVVIDSMWSLAIDLDQESSLSHLEPDGLRHDDCRVCLVLEDLPQRRRDLRCGECGGRHLVQERLEEMAIPSIDEKHVDRRVS